MAEPIKNYLKNVDVQYISLVGKGANKRELICRVISIPSINAVPELIHQETRIETNKRIN